MGVDGAQYDVTVCRRGLPGMAMRSVCGDVNAEVSVDCVTKDVSLL